MTNYEKQLRQSARAMTIVGWSLAIGLLLLLFVYPPGFFWGALPESLPLIGPAHPPSPYNGLHPYLYMLVALYLAYGILMIRGARDPKANAALFDYGILANLMHALVMVPQAFVYPNEHAHLWADIPVCLVICIVLWIWHPNRVTTHDQTH
jgi:hypothetical protein